MAEPTTAGFAEQDAPLQSVSSAIAASVPATFDPLISASTEPGSSSGIGESQGPTFRFAEPSQILRAHQRDLSQLSRLHNLLLDVTHPPTSLRFPFSSAISSFASRLLSSITRGEGLESFARLVYLGLTFGLASQTIGEEYVDVLPYATRKARFPSLRRRWAVLSIVVGGPVVLRGIIGWLRRNNAPSDVGREEGAAPGRTRTIRRSLLAFLSSGLVSSLPELWFAWFLLRGRNISWEKGLGGLRYITALPPDSSSSSRPTYEPLGILMLLPIVTRAISSWRERVAARSVARRALEGGTANSGLARGEGEKGINIQTKDRNISRANASTGVETDRRFQIDRKPVKLVVIGTEESDPEGITASGPTSATFGTSLMPDHVAISSASENEDRKTILSPNDFSHPDRQCSLCLSSRGSIKDTDGGGGGTVVTECGHVFCGSCIEEWAVEKMECPLCRQELRLERLIPVYNL